MFKVALENGHEALGYTAGKMRRTASGSSRATA
jgi:translation initiation factor IF-1